MSNAIQPRPLAPLMEQVQQLGIKPRSPLWQLFQDLAIRSDKTQTNLGEIKKEANLTGRTEALSSTLQNVTSAGQLNSLLNVVSDRNAANISETTNLKWRTAAHSATQPVNIAITGTDSGAGHASVSYPDFTQRVPGIGDYTITSFLALGLSNSTKYYLYKDDADFNNGGSSFLSSDPNALFQSTSRMYLGSVTTPAGGAGPTTGVAGGTGGSRNLSSVV